MRRAGWLLLLGALLAIALPVPLAFAQEATTEISLGTNFPGRVVGPGNSASFILTVGGPVGERIEFEIIGVPEGWTTSLMGAGAVITEAMIPSDAPANATLGVSVPAEAAEGDYTLTVVVAGDSGSDRLDLNVRVAEAASGGVSLTTEFPALRGAADSTYAFTLRLANDTSQEVQFGLSGEGPSGWELDVQPSGQTRAATITLAAGESGTILAMVDPPDTTVAGQYSLQVRAEGGGETAEAQVTVEITGNYALSFTAANELLDFKIEAGSATQLTLLVTNTGTAPLTAVAFSGTVPSDWEIAFSPTIIDQLSPDGTATVTATITAANNAIAGDYAMAVSASVAETSDTIELRATVQTSALWGLVGIGVIVVALGALGVVFWRFGRR
jgi:uncharacterized membrane protein